jgi:hypothetical protein
MASVMQKVVTQGAEQEKIIGFRAGVSNIKEFCFLHFIYLTI